MRVINGGGGDDLPPDPPISQAEDVTLVINELMENASKFKGLIVIGVDKDNMVSSAITSFDSTFAVIGILESVKTSYLNKIYED